MIKPSELEVFVLSYNRAELIGETLQSIVSQSVCGFSITVFDNGSTDVTREVVESFDGIKFVSADKNYGAEWNYNRAIKAPTKKYAMLFHDDDTLHPKYIEYALMLASMYPDANVICSRTENLEDDLLRDWPDREMDHIYFTNVSDFATHVYSGYGLSFASVIYKSEALKKVASIDFTKYGKISDRPLVFDAIADGGAVAFTCPFVRYRIHPGQDCAVSTNGPWFTQFFELNKKYKSLMQNGNSLKNHIMYSVLVFEYLRREYKILPENTKHDFDQYIDMALENGVLSKAELFIGRILYFSGVSFVFRAFRYFWRNYGC
jgi:glycosyltransferase involved in cell wall biosynthesis